MKVVMVLGHSDCGAVKAAIEVANGTAGYPAGEFGAIGEVVDPIVPPIETMPKADRTVPRCISANARAQADDMASRGPIVRQAIETGAIEVVAAVYDIGTGQVSLL